ncbi:hypothetical protein BOX15_Mlig004400g1 [Macrostomum lignano]|uniref:RH1 domain-containing protein n=1 Tax=Macrostomum lignano TaxID=282301 RepID=A0A267FBF8_9PLAT|nr:hypothetical protein BOX15_Mlig004400g1 [Macrostomum lignano]
MYAHQFSNGDILVEQQNSSSPTVLSDCVQDLATSIYAEFERVVQRYDEDAVRGLMPLVVGALESLESSLASQSNFQAELGLLRAESASQLEREIRARRQVEALLAAAEEAASEEREAWRRTSASEAEARRRLSRRLEEAAAADEDLKAFKETERLVDILNGEIVELREAVSKLQSTKERLTARINYADRDNESLLRQLCQAEESIVKFQTQLSSETATADSSAQTDDTVECGNHPAVTQVEVTRLLMERNAYKERLIELQEAVKKADCMRAAARLDQMRRRNDEDAQAKVSSRGRQRQRGRRQQEKPQLESGGRVTAAVRNLFGGLWSSLTTGPAQPVLGTPVDLNRPMLLD